MITTHFTGRCRQTIFGSERALTVAAVVLCAPLQGTGLFIQHLGVLHQISSLRLDGPATRQPPCHPCEVARCRARFAWSTDMFQSRRNSRLNGRLRREVARWPKFAGHQSAHLPPFFFADTWRPSMRLIKGFFLALQVFQSRHRLSRLRMRLSPLPATIAHDLGRYLLLPAAWTKPRSSRPLHRGWHHHF